MIPITNRINKFILTKSFPDELKVADVTPVFTKDDANNKTNFRPISLLPMISKIFERVLLDQIEKVPENTLSPKLCGSRTVHSTQHVLLDLLKTWQKTLEKSGVTGTVLMELCNAYDCLPHDLFIAKLAAYGSEDSATSLTSDCLSRRYQRVKIGSVFTSYLETLRGIPQGWILGLILFNIFIIDLIFFILPMTLLYTHAHSIIKKQPMNYLMIHMLL